MAMQIQVLDQVDNRIKFSLNGAGHTFCNNLKHELYAEKDIEYAAYKVDHPLVSIPTFLIQKSSKTKFSAILKSAAKRIKDDNKSFLAALKKL